MRYIIAPLDLTTDELEIYRLLYKKADFETMITVYTLEQLSVDSDIRLNLKRDKISRIIKKFIKNRYIEVVCKGSKGNPSVYKIAKISEIIQENVRNKPETNATNVNIKSETNEQITLINTGFEPPNRTNVNIKSETNENKPETNAIPINDKEKEKENIYIDVLKHLNSKANTKYRSSSAKSKSLIKARLKEGFTLEDFKTVIDKKTSSWLNTDMEKFLRPETLFGNKFEGYLNELSNSNKEVHKSTWTKKEFI